MNGILPDRAQGAVSDPSPAFKMRAALAAAGVAYVAWRFGITPGLQIAAAALLYVALDWVPIRFAGRRLAWVNIPLAGLQVAVFAALFLAPAPFGFLSAVPMPARLFSPLFLVLMLLVAATASPPRPLVTLSAGLTAMLAWALLRPLSLLDPAMMVKADIMRNISHYKTTLELVRALNGPHYFNMDIWRINLILFGIGVAALTLSAFRTQRLAKRSAHRQAERDALSAYFSPQLVDVILNAGPKGLAPQDRDVAVLNGDLVGFTRLAETMDPESVARTLRAYRTVAEDAVLSRNGAILAHQGDGFTAVFGLTGDETASVTAALASAHAIAQQWPSATDGTPAIGIGIDYGRARVGLVGQGRSLTLLMLGAPVEGALRLQGETRKAGTQILLGDAAAAQLARERVLPGHDEAAALTMQ